MISLALAGVQTTEKTSLAVTVAQRCQRVRQGRVGRLFALAPRQLAKALQRGECDAQLVRLGGGCSGRTTACLIMMRNPPSDRSGSFAIRG